MEYVIAWSGFIGGWLLVAGPMYQGGLELNAESSNFDAFHPSEAVRGARSEVSPWWWLLPPVAVIKLKQEGARHRREFMNSLTPQQIATLVSFSNKATGWFIVAAGAFFIAVKETWHLCHLNHWPAWVYAPIVVIPLALCVSFTARQVRRTDTVLATTN